VSLFGQIHVVFSVKLNSRFDILKIMLAVFAIFQMSFDFDASGRVEFFPEIIANVIHYVFARNFI
jgi:hypothetical protein